MADNSLEKTGILRSIYLMLVFGAHERERLYTHFSQELSAGNSIKQAQDNYLRLLRETKKTAQAKLLSKVFKAERQGKAIGEAFENAIPHDERGLLNAGAKAGDGSASFDLAKQVIEQKKTSGLGPVLMLFYPLLTLALSFRAWSVLGETLAQMEDSVLKGASFHGAAGLLTTFYRNEAFFQITALVLVVGIILLFAYALPNWKGPMRTKADKVFPFSIYRQYNSAQFLISLASMNKGGISEKNALQDIANHSSPWLKIRIEKMLKTMQNKGVSLGEASLQCGFNIPDLEQTLIIASMKNTEKFGDQLMSLAQKAHSTALVKLRLTLSTLFFCLLGLALVTQLTLPLATQTMQEQIDEHSQDY